MPLIEKGYQFRFNKDFSTEALSTIWKCHYRTAYLLLKPGWLKTDIWIMEKRLTCLAEITAVLSLLGLRFQVQGSTIG